MKTAWLLLGTSLVGLLLASRMEAASASDPTAARVLSSATAALSGGISLSDLTLEATVQYTSGSDEENGTATLKAKGEVESLMSLNLNKGRGRR